MACSAITPRSPPAKRGCARSQGHSCGLLGLCGSRFAGRNDGALSPDPPARRDRARQINGGREGGGGGAREGEGW